MHGWWSPPVNGIVLDGWRQHPCRLAGPAAPALVAAAGWLFFAGGPRSPVMQAALGVLAMVLVLRFVWRLINWWADWVVVTDKQVVRASGVLARDATVLQLAHVTGLHCHRSVLGRVFGYGEGTLESENHAQTPMHLSFIPKPDERCALITQLLAKSVSYPIRGLAVP